MLTEQSTVPAAAAGADEPAPWRPVLTARPILLAMATTAVLTLVLLRLGLHWSTLPVLALASTAPALTAVDAVVLRLPNALVRPTAAAVAAACAIQLAAERDVRLLEREVGCAAGVGGFYLLLYVLSRRGLGFGDVRLAAITGLALGVRGWAAAFDATLLAYVITLPIILVLLLRGRRQFPMGPGILAGSLAVLLF